MLLREVHCGTTGSRAVAIVSEDTNVFIVSVLHPRCLVPCMLNVVQRQYFDVQKLVHMLGAEQCCALPGLHAFTGCDTVSAFASRGKLKGLRLMSKSAQLTLLGSH